MNDKPKKPGRPKKQKHKPADSRAPDRFNDEISEAEQIAIASDYRQKTINRLRVAPQSDLEWAGIFAPVILGQATETRKKDAGQIFCGILERATPECLESFFRELAALKRNAEFAHRNAYGYYAYSRYIEEAGREPTKSELRKYIIARPSEFKDQPAAEDKKGWTRVWADSGLSTLPSG